MFLNLIIMNVQFKKFSLSHLWIPSEQTERIWPYHLNWLDWNWMNHKDAVNLNHIEAVNIRNHKYQNQKLPILLLHKERHERR